MPWKFPFLSWKFLQDYGALWALLVLSLQNPFKKGLAGGSLVEHKSLKSLECGEDVVILRLVKNLGLLGSENMLKIC